MVIIDHFSSSSFMFLLLHIIALGLYSGNQVTKFCYRRYRCTCTVFCPFGRLIRLVMQVSFRTILPAIGWLFPNISAFFHTNWPHFYMCHLTSFYQYDVNINDVCHLWTNVIKCTFSTLSFLLSFHQSHSIQYITLNSQITLK